MMPPCPNCSSCFAELPSYPDPDVLNHLTYGHFCIQEDEVSRLDRAISDDENVVSRLETQLNHITALQTKLNDLHTQVYGRRMEYIKRYIKRIKQCHAVKAPWRKLPPELLAQIFASCLQAELQPSTQQPWKLGQVCRRWRAVVQSDPRLWCSLPPIRWTPQIQQHHENVIISALEASCELPLEVQLIIAEWDGNLTLEIFLPFAHKFRTFRTSVEIMDLPALSVIAQRFNALTNLDLCLDSLTQRDNSTISQDIFKYCLALEHVALKISRRDDRPFPFAEFCFPWSNLVSFFGEGLRPSDIHFILKHAVNLRKCDFSFNHTWTADADRVRSLPSITNEALTDIRISDDPHISELVSKLALPNLLRLSLPSFQMETAHPAFLPFLSCSTNLTSVDLRSLTIDGQTIMACLGRVSTLADLYIRFSLELFVFLTPEAGVDSPYFPCLNNLFIENMPTDGTQEACYVLIHALLNSRTPGSLAVETGAISPLVFLAVRFAGARAEKYCQNLFYRLDGWKKVDPDWRSTCAWRDFINSFLNKQVVDEADALLLEALLLEIKRHCDTLHPRYLRDRSLMKTVRKLYTAFSKFSSAASDINPPTGRQWQDAVKAHLHSPGWMCLRKEDFAPVVLFYGIRDGKVAIEKAALPKWPFIRSIINP